VRLNLVVRLANKGRSMDKEHEKQLDIAVESVKQQITLASALLAAALAFANQLKDGLQTRAWSRLPWIAAPLALAIVFGVLCLMSLSYYLTRSVNPMGERGVRLLGGLQNLSFIAAALLSVWLLHA
jgi:hypothetical protein